MANFVPRFGKIEAKQTGVSDSGRAWGSFTINCGKFSVRGATFKPELIAKLESASVGDKIWARGPIDVATSMFEGKERTYRTLVAYHLTVGEAKDAAQGDDAAAETIDAANEVVIVDEAVAEEDAPALDLAETNPLAEIAAALSVNETAAIAAVIDAQIDGVALSLINTPSKTEAGGEMIIPGRAIYQRLARRGLLTIEGDTISMSDQTVPVYQALAASVSA